MPAPVNALYSVDCYVVLANGSTQGCLELRADTAKEQKMIKQLFLEAEQDGFWDPSRIRLDYRALDGYRFWSDKLGEVDSDDYPAGRKNIFRQSTFYLHEFDGQTRAADVDEPHCHCLDDRSCLTCRLQRAVKVAELKAHRAEERTRLILEALDSLCSAKRADEEGSFGHGFHDQGYPDSASDGSRDDDSSGDHDSQPPKRGGGGKTRPGQMGGKRKRREEMDEVFVVVDEEEDVADEKVGDTSEVDDDKDFEPAPKRQKSKAGNSGRGLLPKKAKATARVARSASVDTTKAVKVAKARKTNNSMGSSLDQDPAATIAALASAPTTAAARVANGNGRAKAWTDTERQALISLVTAHRNPPAGSGQQILYDVALFQLISTQLEQQYGIKRSPGGCKNEFNRRGRNESQVDNRKIANGKRMETSMQ